MNYSISVQPTPNPQAMKFVFNVPLKTTDTAVFKKEGAHTIPLVKAVFALEAQGITEVFLSGNFMTITRNTDQGWDEAESAIKHVLLSKIADHNPEFDTTKKEDTKKVDIADEELAKIDAILERTIRPALQRDGGDLQLVSLQDKILTISYQGACGCCPHAAYGTLFAIQNILNDQYDPDLEVRMG